MEDELKTKGWVSTIILDSPEWCRRYILNYGRGFYIDGFSEFTP